MSVFTSLPCSPSGTRRSFTIRRALSWRLFIDSLHGDPHPRYETNGL